MVSTEPKPLGYTDYGAVCDANWARTCRKLHCHPEVRRKLSPLAADVRREGGRGPAFQVYVKRLVPILRRGRDAGWIDVAEHRFGVVYLVLLVCSDRLIELWSGKSQEPACDCPGAAGNRRESCEFAARDERPTSFVEALDGCPFFGGVLREHGEPELALEFECDSRAFFELFLKTGALLFTEVQWMETGGTPAD